MNTPILPSQHIPPKVRVGVVGASGYVGLELIRLLLQHPQVSLELVTSREQQGQPLHSVHPSLLGLSTLTFERTPDASTPPAQFRALCGDLDFVFLALPHAQSAPLVGALWNAPWFADAALRIIDLGADFRLSAELFKKFYRVDHPHPELLPQAVYGVPEIQRAHIQKARLIANPGCFAICTTLGLLPLVRASTLPSRPLTAHVSAVTGSTGSGATPTPKTHHPARNESMSAYEILTHRHIPEIEYALSLGGAETLPGSPRQESSPVEVHLVPHSGNFSRGIYATIFVTLREGASDVASLYQRFAEEESFLRYRESSPRLMDVKGTNFCDFSVRQQGNEVVIISTIDNLVKGAAGNALQNMNVMCGFPETTGLWHAALAP